MGALLPPGVLCAPPGVFYNGGAPAMRGAPGCLGLGHNVALLVLWLRGPFCPPVFGLFGAWLLGVDMTAAVAPFFTLFLPIKSPPLSTDRDTGMHMTMVTVRHFYLLNLHLCLPTKIRGYIWSHCL